MSRVANYTVVETYGDPDVCVRGRCYAVYRYFDRECTGQICVNGGRVRVRSSEPFRDALLIALVYGDVGPLVAVL